MNTIEINTNITILYDKGTEVFGSLRKFTKWLLEDNIKLENKKTIDVIKTEEGYKVVMTELMHINDGAFSLDKIDLETFISL